MFYTLELPEIFDSPGVVSLWATGKVVLGVPGKVFFGVTDGSIFTVFCPNSL